MRISALTVFPRSLALVPPDGEPSKVEISLIVTEDDGRPVENAEINAYAGNGTLLKDGQPVGRHLRLIAPTGGARFEFMAGSGDADKERTLPGRVLIALLAGDPEQPADTAVVEVIAIGPPAFLTLTAAPDRVLPGELVTVTASVKDAIGQNVVDGTKVRFTTTPEGKLSDEEAITVNGVCITFLLTSNQAPGIYSIVASCAGIRTVVSASTSGSMQHG